MNILIWSYKLKPEDGVGGRRWRKYGGLLASMGHQVFIATRKDSLYEPGSPNSPNFIPLDNHGSRSAILEKIRKRLFRFRQRYFNGDALDYEEPWSRRNVRKIFEIIKNNDIDVLIASGHPCSINYYAGLIKSEFPRLRLVQDFRDLWQEERNYGFLFNGFSLSYKERMATAEALAINHADVILAVSEGQKQRLERKYRNSVGKVEVIFNGFVSNETFLPSPPCCDEFTLIHAGTIRWQALDAYVLFLKALRKLKEQLREINFRVDFYGGKKIDGLERSLQQVEKEFCNFYPYIDEELLSERIRESHLGLMIFDKDTGLGTKVFDYMREKKKVFAIVPEGELYYFCKNNYLFSAVFDETEIESELSRIIKVKDEVGRDLDDMSFYSVECQARLLERHLIRVLNE